MSILFHERITAIPSPLQWIFIVHGFLGTGNNWRTFARQVVAQKPEYGAVLLDLRLHGHSQDFTPPHSVASAAKDLVYLTKEFKQPIRAVLGHSFGAKVALNFVELYPQLDTAWLIDFTPWSQPYPSASSTFKILRMLAPLVHKIFSSRKEFITKLISQGLDNNTAQWLAMNVEENNSKYYLRIRPKELQELLEDYFKQDLEYILSKIITTNIFFALGEKSEVLNFQDQQRIIAITQKNPDKLRAFIIKNAGHYVHMDAHDELLALVITSLK
jgi:pimeloyl-ACP methyl ester carboxylesterase